MLSAPAGFENNLKLRKLTAMVPTPAAKIIAEGYIGKGVIFFFNNPYLPLNNKIFTAFPSYRLIEKPL
jgi:hypothetical protein